MNNTFSEDLHRQKLDDEVKRLSNASAMKRISQYLLGSLGVATISAVALDTFEAIEISGGGAVTSGG